MKQDAILVFDFGGQYCHLIARRIRDNNVYSEIVPNDLSIKGLESLKKKFDIKGLVLSGGPMSIYEKNAPQADKRILNLGMPILGICYGHHLIAHYVGGDVKAADKKEYGIAFADIKKTTGLFNGLERKEQIWMSHGTTVFSVPKGFEVLATTQNSPVAAFANKQKHIYGIQWHPEVIHTKNGDRIFRNFLFDICKCEPNWKVGDLVADYVKEINDMVGRKNALVALSGGVDSSTAAAIASKALKKRLTAVYVDNGLMRQGETEQVKRMAGGFGVTFVYVDARKRFVDRLKGIIDPEQKRKIIGKEFIVVFEEAAKKINADYLVQGTIYPDRIESGHSKKSQVIKTHHNVGGLPTKIKFKGLVEPLRDMYKDEVRRIAKHLGLPDEIVNRQPFPGPGLAVRIVGDVTKKKLGILRRADHIVTEEIEKQGLKDGLWQYFAVLTDTKSTGVKGDARSYGDVVAIRVVESKDAMTAVFSKLPYDALETISTRITNEIPEVNRVVYDITNKPPSTIEWE